MSTSNQPSFPVTECACPARKALSFVQNFLHNLEGSDTDDPLRKIRLKFHTPLHAEIYAALATPCPCTELRGIEHVVGFCGNPGELASVIDKNMQHAEKTRDLMKQWACKAGEWAAENGKLRAELAAAHERAERCIAKMLRQRGEP